MLRLFAIPAGLIVLLVGAMVWSGAAGQHEEPADFVFINRDDINTLDPKSMSWLQDIRLAYGIWEGLYTLDTKDELTMKAIPGASKPAEISPDGTVYTFHIREDARWSNGDPLLAGDFVFAWRRMLEEPGDYTYLLHYIKGARAYENAYQSRVEALTNGATTRPVDFADVGIVATDERTLRVTLTHPVDFFLDLCAFPPFVPLHEPSMRKIEVRDAKTGQVTYEKNFTHPPALVGNGPYRVEQWEFKKRLRLVASEYYWNKAAVKSHRIDMLSFAGPETAFLKYETDSVDWFAGVTNDVAAGLVAKGRKDIHIFPGFGTYFYSINCRDTLPDGSANPFKDVRVRRAFSMAIDRKPIVEKIGQLGQPEATHFVPPGLFPGYPTPRGTGFDPKRARELLAEAGYPAGKGFPEVALLFTNEGEHTMVAQNVGRQWHDVLNVPINMGGVEVKTFRQRVHSKDFTISRGGWTGDYNDVSTFSDKYLSDSDNNDSDWRNPEYDKLCEEATVERDPAKRLALLSHAEQILCDEMPIIPLYHYVSAYLIRENVKGIPLNPRNMVMLHTVEVHH